MLFLEGRNSVVDIQNTSMCSKDPTGMLTPELVAVSGISIQGEYLDVRISESNFRWLGQRAVILNGKNCSVDVVSSEFYQNIASFIDGVTDGGSAIAAYGPGLNVRMWACNIVGHYSDTRGGAILVDGDDCRLDLGFSTIDACQAGENGGAIAFEGRRGRLTVTNGSQLTLNLVYGFDGGAVLFRSPGGSALLDGVVLEGNAAYGRGGGAFIDAESVLLNNVTITANVGGTGGGLYLQAPSSTLSSSLLLRNIAQGSTGGGLHYGYCGDHSCRGQESLPGRLLVNNCSLIGNVATSGGGLSLRAWARVHLNQSRLQHNEAFNDGGGILADTPADAPADYAASALNLGDPGLEADSCIFASNLARRGNGGGAAVTNGHARFSTCDFVGNRAAEGGGGGLFMAGYPKGGAAGVQGGQAWWVVQGCHFRGNVAGQDGGAVLSKDLWYRAEALASGLGIPITFLHNGRQVLCRGRGTLYDFDGVANDVPEASSQAGRSSVDEPQPLGNRTVFSTSALPPPGNSATLQDALLVGFSADEGTALFYLNWGFELVAVDVASGRQLGRASVPANAAFTQPNRVPLIPGSQIPVLVPRIADTNYWWHFVYGGWGLSHVALGRWVYVSTFHSTVMVSVPSSPAPGAQAAVSFRTMEGCESEISAMVAAPDERTLFLGRYTGVGTLYQVYAYPLSRMELGAPRGPCVPHDWGQSTPVVEVGIGLGPPNDAAGAASAANSRVVAGGASLSFAQIRAMAVAEDGEWLFVAEGLDWVGEMQETQAIRKVGLRTGFSVYLESGSSGERLRLDSVAALRPVAGSPTDLLVLTAPGGWLGGLDGSTAVAWAVWRVGSGRLRVAETDFQDNFAGRSGGGLAGRQTATVRLDDCSLTGNVAASSGGAMSLDEGAEAELEACVLEGNRADAAGSDEGGGISIVGSALARVRATRLTHNRAPLGSGGAIFAHSTRQLVLMAPVNLTDNFAGLDGGALWISPLNATCRNGQNWISDAAGMIGGLTLIHTDADFIIANNVAGRGGGGIFYACAQPDAAAWKFFQAASDLSKLEASLVIQGNQAGYGPVVGTPSVGLRVMNQSLRKRYFPGQLFDVRLAVVDGYNQTVRHLTRSSPIVSTSTPLMTLAVSTRGSVSGSVSFSVHSFSADGICDLGSDGMGLSWPARDLPSGGRSFDSTLAVSILSWVASSEVSAVETSEGVVLGGQAAMEVSLERDACPEGRSFDLSHGTCLSCLKSQYVLPPNDLNSCQDCPLGAVCDGRGLVGRVTGSLWARAGQRLRIDHCPAGYVLVRNEDQPLTDDCVACPEGKFRTMHSDYRPPSSRPDQPDQWSLTAANASRLCLDCPEKAADGFKCPGGHVIEPADIEIFSLAKAFNESAGFDSDLPAPCREKLTVCGTFSIHAPVRFLIRDHRPHITSLASQATWKSAISFAVVAGGGVSFNGTAEVRGSWPSAEQESLIEFRMSELGVHVLAIYVDRVQIPNSPFLFQVDKGDCAGLGGRVADSNGGCSCQDGSAALTSDGTCFSLALVLLFIATPLLVLVVLIRRMLQQPAPAEAALQQALKRLRQRLGLTRREGFVLSSEWYPWWQRAGVVVIPRSYLEAAARLDLMLQECDVKLVDGVCLCLHSCPVQYARVCDWLLDLSGLLLDPAAQKAHSDGPLDGRNSSASPKDHPSGVGTSHPDESNLKGARRVRWNLWRCGEMVYDWGEAGGAVLSDKGFRFFLDKVCRVQQSFVSWYPHFTRLSCATNPVRQAATIIYEDLDDNSAAVKGKQVWREPWVFARLKGVSQTIMDNLARRCDLRYAVLAQEEGGRELLASDVLPPCVAMRSHVPVDSPNRASAQQKLAGVVRAEMLLEVDGDCISRQDAVQVGAVRADEVDRCEAALEATFQCSHAAANAATAAAHAQRALMRGGGASAKRLQDLGRLDPSTRRTAPPPPQALFDEGVFLAQLARRAELLNAAFQAAVLAVVRARALLGKDHGGGNGEIESEVLWARRRCASLSASLASCSHCDEDTSAIQPSQSHGGRRCPAGPLAVCSVLVREPSPQPRGLNAPSQRSNAPSQRSASPPGGRGESGVDSDAGSWPKDCAAEDTVGGDDAGGCWEGEVLFADGPGKVSVHAAPAKGLGRMREKLGEYAGAPPPRGTWPLTASILDPVRASIVVDGPARIRQVVGWFAETGDEADTTPLVADMERESVGSGQLRLCRVKNGFGLPREEVVDGYRDFKLFLLFAGPDNLRVIGEVQVHDRAMHDLKQSMHRLYRVKRATGPDSI